MNFNETNKDGTASFKFICLTDIRDTQRFELGIGLGLGIEKKIISYVNMIYDLKMYTRMRYKKKNSSRYLTEKLQIIQAKLESLSNKEYELVFKHRHKKSSDEKRKKIINDIIALSKSE